MFRNLLICASLLILPSLALAAPNVGGCGLGSKLFDGHEGIAPQVMAAITNACSGNQTFGISSGTSGCTQTGVVRTNWKTAMFIDSNVSKIARDMSVGRGETIDSLAALMEMDEEVQQVFSSVARDNFERIFPSEEVTADHVIGALRLIMLENIDLAPYAEKI